MKVVLIILSLLCVSVSARAEPLFFEALYDVPVMPGLTEIPEKSVLFDTPGGTIAQSGAAATASLEKGQIIDFYAETLPQLGWQAQSDGSYLREGERLLLGVEEGAPPYTLLFRLEPQ